MSCANTSTTVLVQSSFHCSYLFWPLWNEYGLLRIKLSSVMLQRSFDGTVSRRYTYIVAS